MDPERRNCARRILYSPEYLDMGADNGGVVVDLSEGGLRFQAVGRVEPDSDAVLSFSLGTCYRIDAEAHIVWVGARGNSGGVAFKNLSKDSRSLIREWLDKPESEQRAEAAVSTPEIAEEPEDNSLDSAQPEKLIEPATAPALNLASPAKDEILAREPFEEPLPEGRVEEISAPGEPIFQLDIPEPLSQSPQLNPSRQPAAPVAMMAKQVPQATVAPRSEAGHISAVVEIPAPPHATVREFRAGNVRPETPASTAMTSATVTPRSPSFPPKVTTPPQSPPTERRSSQGSGASFSVVPSISAWNGEGAPKPLMPKRPNPLQSRAPLFPPRDAENIFARRWTPPQVDESARHGNKAFFAAVIVLLLIIAALLVYAYTGGYRQQIGAAIERVGSTVAGQAGSAADVSAPSAPAKSTAPAGNGSSSAASSAVTPQKAAPANANPPAGSVPAQPTAPPVPPVKSNFAANAPASLPKTGSAAPGSSLANAVTPPTNPSAPPRDKSDKPLAQPPSAQAESAPAYLHPTAQNQSAKSPGASNSAANAILQNAARSEYLRGQQYLTGTGGFAPDPTEAAEWFWRSLEAGDTDAALPLADLYLQGKGVSQSCTQARILLDAAVRKGNAQAARKLGQLPGNCD